MNLRTLIIRAFYFALGLYNGFFFLPGLRNIGLLLDWEKYMAEIKRLQISLTFHPTNIFFIFFPLFPALVALGVIVVIIELRHEGSKNLNVFLIGLGLGILALIATIIYAMIQVMEAMWWSGDF